MSHASSAYSNGFARRRYARLSPLRLLRDLASLRRQRLALRDLDDHLLEDLGLSRDAANAEAARPLWDAPTHWIQRP